MANRRTKVRFPIFSGYEVRVILSDDLIRTGQRLGIDLSGAGAAYVEDRAMLKGWLVFSTNPTAGTISHEASHAVRAMFNTVGARTDNETFAYHLGYLVDRIHKFLKRK